MFLASCSVGRYLPPGERLYAGTDIRIEADSTVSKAESQAIEAELSATARPKPNKRIFGFPYSVWFYYVIGQGKTETGLRGTLRKRFGQPPVLASAKAISSNGSVWASYLENEGYFRSSVTGKLVESGYSARGQYTVQVRPRYMIDSVAFLINTADSLAQPVLAALAKIAPQTVLKKGNPYRFAAIQIEQQRITEALKHQGFYYFLPTYVKVLADSAIGNQRLNMFVALSPDMPDAARHPFTIGQITVYPNYSLSGAGQLAYRNRDRDTTGVRSRSRDTTGVRNRAGRIGRPADDRRVARINRVRLPFVVQDTTGQYKTRLFEEIMGLSTGQVYDSRKQDLTLSRFINVGTFKFVRNQFSPVVRNDSNQLDVRYFLTPYPRQSLRSEIAGLSKSNNATGVQLTLSWANRNLLHRAEQLTINGSAGREVQIGAASQGVNTFRYGLDATMAFPRLISPIHIRYDENQALPKTLISAGYEALIREDLYRLSSFRASFGYAIRTNQRVEQTLTPFNVTFVRPSRFTPSFYFQLDTLPSESSQQYRNILLSEQLIFSSLYSLNLSPSSQTTSPYTFRLGINAEIAGNVVNAFLKESPMSLQKEIYGVRVAQYARVDADTRHYLKLNSRLTWASRVFAGFGLPYGNSTVLPLVKQYFVGGSNSLRGFQPRSIGPGVNQRPPSTGAPLLQDGGGDIKLETNTELRLKFNQFLQGAVFLDAGNVWIYKDEMVAGEGNTFSSNFLNELAVSAGAGLRIDLGYFVLRADLAFPLRRPYPTNDEFWVTRQIDFGSRDWRRNNLILNIAIGYPF
jgi:outer membrane protein insertion porin family